MSAAHQVSRYLEGEELTPTSGRTRVRASSSHSTSLRASYELNEGVLTPPPAGARRAPGRCRC